MHLVQRFRKPPEVVILVELVTRPYLAVCPLGQQYRVIDVQHAVCTTDPCSPFLDTRFVPPRIVRRHTRRRIDLQNRAPVILFYEQRPVCQASRQIAKRCSSPARNGREDCLRIATGAHAACSCQERRQASSPNGIITT